jgi:hypothetical protein
VIVFEPRLARLKAHNLLTELYSLINSTDRAVNMSKAQGVKRKDTSNRLDSLAWNLPEAETEIY